MCAKETECQKPKELKNKPEDCTVEQIRKCHGVAAKNPCTKQNDGRA